MRISLVTGIFLLFCISCVCAPKVETISILDFGARPNDGKDDHSAFEKLSKYINEKKRNIVVVIPEGVYQVGRQIRNSESNYYLIGQDVIRIENCNNIKILGQKGTKLLFNVGMRFGSFDPETGNSTDKTFECVPKNNVAKERAMLGKMINIVNSDNVTVSNLILDGNFYSETLNNMNSFEIRNLKKNAKFQQKSINIGGGYGNCGIQIEHYGIVVFHSNNVHISHVNSKRFGTDGLMIANVDNKHKNIIVSNSSFDYNSRTGIAIGGGKDIIIKRCDLKNTGRLLYISTATGIDIEPEADATVYEKTVSNLLIDECYFSGNSEGAILAKFGGRSNNIRVKNCNISSDRTAVVVGEKVKDFNFQNNKLNGGEFILNGEKRTDVKDGGIYHFN